MLSEVVKKKSRNHKPCRKSVNREIRNRYNVHTQVYTAKLWHRNEIIFATKAIYTSDPIQLFRFCSSEITISNPLAPLRFT
jgi:hypothetical protein